MAILQVFSNLIGRVLEKELQENISLKQIVHKPATACPEAGRIFSGVRLMQKRFERVQAGVLRNPLPAKLLGRQATAVLDSLDRAI